ncbi:uncharacterized protein [Dysidea avara]|uniref:uncharacterized protein n=1 Tax=Dysidea avara TaxID=196820 RepID=UPI003328129E
MASLFGIRLLTRTSLVTRSLLLARHSQPILQRGFSDAEKPTIYVGRIPPNTTEEELQTNFPGCVAVRIIKDRSTGLSKGFGFVDYPSFEEAKEAVHLTVEIGGHVLALGQAKNTPRENYRSNIRHRNQNTEPSASLYVGNLSHTTTESDLMKAFDGCVDAALIVDPQTGESKGYGFVEYSSVDEAKEVREKQEEIVLDGHTLVINYSLSRKKKDRWVKSKENKEPYPILFVGNLPYAATESDLMKTFDGCVKATIVFDDTSKSKRYGFVHYSTIDEAKAVFDKQEDIVLDGCSLFVEYSFPKDGSNSSPKDLSDGDSSSDSDSDNSK